MTILFQDKKVAVTGAAGLIGSFLVDHLVAAGADVIAIDDLSKGRLDNLRSVLDRTTLRIGDLEDPAFARESLADARIVFHLASRAYGIAHSSQHHWAMLMHNERLNNAVLDALVDSDIEALLVTSSSCVYSDDGLDAMAEAPVFLGEPEAANRGYGWAKRFLEQKATLWSEQTGKPVTIVRPFNIYGERYVWQGQASQAIPMLVKRILDRTDPVVIWGSGNQRRTYIHAHDCAAIMMALLTHGVFDGPVNIGFEETVTMRELVALILASAGLSSDVETDTEKPEGRFVKSADSARLRACLPGFEPAIGLEEGIDRMVEWYHREFKTA